MTKEKGNIFIQDIQKRKRRRAVLVYSLALVGAIGLFIALGFVGKKQSDTRCWKLEVQVEPTDGRKFIDEQMVAALADSATDAIVGKTINEIDLGAIHKAVQANTSVREAHVYTTVDGRCVIQVKQRTPIARIFNRMGESYYLDSDGHTMELSGLTTVKLPVFTGEISDGMRSGSVVENVPDSLALNSTLDEIYHFTQIVARDTFWSAQIEHVFINPALEFEIIPRVGEQRVNVGYIYNMETKLKKLRAFYEHAVIHDDIDRFSTIKAQYDGQVVCVKR
ncbi:MAG: cell division protein FtsQ/DivIB [Flavobacteriales bacterium]